MNGKTGRTILAAVLAVCLAIAAVGCSQEVLDELASESAAALATPTPTATPTMTATPTPTPAATVAPTVTPDPTPTPAPTPQVQVVPVPAALFATQPGTTSLDTDGDGIANIVRFDPMDISPDGCYTIEVDGTVYETQVPADGSPTEFYLTDMNTADDATEFMFVQDMGDRSALYLYRVAHGMLLSASFTYTLPAELSATYTPEERMNEPMLIYSGVGPIVGFGDGSFALVTFGQGFTRYALDSTFEVNEAGALSLNILSGGQVPMLETEAVAG